MKNIVKKFKCSSDKAEFNKENIFSNIKSATKLFYFVIVFEIIMLLRVILIKERPLPDYMLNYVFCYVFLLILSVITLVGTELAKYLKKEYVRIVYIITTIYELGFLLWGVAITTLDSYNTERFIVYLTVVVSMTSMLKLRPWVFFLIEIGGYFLLNAALFYYLHRFNSAQIINLSVFTIIFVVISITKYNSSVLEFYNKKKIEQLNAMLELEKELLELSVKTDQLTGLYSRNILKADIKKLITENYKMGKAVGIAMFDLDDFKKVNDTYGHTVGDECLKRIGECFKEYSVLTVYRYGGEEFLAICNGITEAEFINTIDKIIKSVSAFKLSVEHLSITISAGYVYHIPENEICDEKMINAADNALYTAKKTGKNRYVKG